MNTRTRQNHVAIGPLRDSLATFHFLGTLDIPATIALQNRLIYEAGGRDDDQLEILLVEHPPTITIGRAGSRGHILLSPKQLENEQLSVQWVGRGGGAVLHQPGQLAIYPIVPLERKGWSVGGYLTRFRAGLSEALGAIRIRVRQSANSPGLWGRTGQIASIGIGVRNWITHHGAWINVDVAPKWLSQVLVGDTSILAPGQRNAMSSLLAERQGRVTMTQMRSALVPALATAFDCPRHHLYTGHPLFRPALRDPRV